MPNKLRIVVFEAVAAVRVRSSSSTTHRLVRLPPPSRSRQGSGLHQRGLEPAKS
ncbi:hypothetical protein TIFTF001_014683 [Ficus carica]|uniref:Uncharacterized protein n=1 Tax=Ficus carica TaxID=3494 RepID=A0AA88AGG5_FICCA|nr:hypothetical protein TIFTF001_014683 [Ficus carica]